jgi:DnaK suppressor protein
MSYSSTVSVMTEEQRAHLRRRLEQERERVVGRLARFGERPVEADRRADEQSDAPFHATHDTDSYNQALDALEISRLSRELADMQDALKLLDETPDRYGLDERTGEPIPFDHLERVPWARTAQPHEQATDLLAADADVLRAYRNERYSG